MPGQPQARVSELWLQVSEVDFITCAGQSLSTSDLMPKPDLAASQLLTVTAPNEEICAMVVRTSPLAEGADASLPPAAVGQGAALEGTDSNDTPFSAIVPQRITSVLTPVAPGLTLAQASTLELKIEDALLIDAIFGAQGGISAVPSNVYDPSTAPLVIDTLAQRLNVAFSLESVTGEERQVLATSSSSWADLDFLLCASECAQSDRISCSSAPCDVNECLTRLTDPECGESFRSALYCRVSLNPDEYSCVDGEISVSTSYCAQLDATYSSCGG